MSISVVVCVYTMDKYDAIVRLIQSLKIQTYNDIEAILVVDEDTRLFQRLGQFISQGSFSFVRLIFNPDNTGLSNARNLGIASASHDVIVFIDDDAFPEPCWAESINATFEEDPSAASVVGTVLPAWDQESMSWFPEELYWIISCSYVLTPKSRQDIDRGFGVNMAFRKQALIECGMFDTRLGIQKNVWLGGEDTDIFLKLRDLGYRIIFEPRMTVHHMIALKRIRFTNVTVRAFRGGISVAKLKCLKAYRMKGSVENRFLRRLFFDFYPKSAASLGRSPSMVPLRRMAFVTAVIIAEGAGYALGLLTTKSSSASSVEISQTINT